MTKKFISKKFWAQKWRADVAFLWEVKSAPIPDFKILSKLVNLDVSPAALQPIKLKSRSDIFLLFLFNDLLFFIFFCSNPLFGEGAKTDRLKKCLDLGFGCPQSGQMNNSHCGTFLEICMFFLWGLVTYIGYF